MQSATSSVIVDTPHPIDLQKRVHPQRLQLQEPRPRPQRVTALVPWQVLTTVVSLCMSGFCIDVADAAQDPRGTAPQNASSPNEVAQPDEKASDDDKSLEHATPDPTPEVPTVLQREGSEPAVDVIEQAGVGGPVAFGSAGVLEVGGSGALIASGDYVMAKLGPTIGWFIYDGVELAYTQEIYGSTEIEGLGFATLGVIDVSVHMRINDRLLGFVGLGPGLSYNGDALGVGGKSRLGLDVLVGRSGLFRPATFFTLTSKPLVDLRGSATAHNWQYGLELEYAALF